MSGQVSKEGAALGTTYLAVASPVHGKMTILGDLQPAGKEVMSKLENVVRDLSGPNKPMHIVEVKVVARMFELDESTIAPPVRREKPLY